MIGAARGALAGQWTRISATSGAAMATRHRTRLLEKRGVRATLLLAPVLLFVVWRQFFIVTDADYWWHVRTGQYIFATGSVPRADLYSYTAAGQPWVAHEWLTELLFYVVQRHVGYVGNVALFGLVSATATFVVYVACRRRGLGEVGAMVLALWGFAMGTASVNARPQAFTALLLAVTALLLALYKQGHRRALWPLPAVLALWVNLHGGYLIGLVLIGTAIIGEAIERARGRPAAPLGLLVAVGALSGAATLLSPHGVEGLLYPFTYAGSDSFAMRRMLEWQSPNFHDPHYLIFGGSLLLAVALGLARQPLGTTELIWGSLFGLMALTSVRHIPLYAVVVMPLIGARLQRELPALRRSLTCWRHPGRIGVTWWLAIGACAVAFTTNAVASAPGAQLGAEPSPATFPAGAVAYLRAHPAEGNLFNDLAWGGYLIYKLYPDRRVFIDGRADLYGNEILERYGEVIELRPGWRAMLDWYGVGQVLVQKGTALAVALAADATWRRVYVGDVEELFTRENPGAPLLGR